MNTTTPTSTMSDSVRVPRSDIRKVWSAAKKLARPWMDGNVTYEEWAEAMDFLEAFSGVAAVAPVEARDAFEAWMASSNYPEIADIALEKLKDGQYKSQLTHAAWQAWQGALNNAPAPAREAVLVEASKLGQAAFKRVTLRVLETYGKFEKQEYLLSGAVAVVDNLPPQEIDLSALASRPAMDVGNG